ncbi:MAG: hypothetical protein GY755_15805 [Chloroflexi bacterium]|nr:hypothetical protein [Chloroflexota bacterium]
MNPWTIFLIGVLVGWLIEWIIDWAYWRREAPPESANKSDEVSDLRQENAKLKSRLTLCDEIKPHQLERIKGIGPAIKKRLNKNKIKTFSQLADITPQHLIEIVGEQIKHLVDENEIIHQAKDFASLI